MREGYLVAFLAFLVLGIYYPAIFAPFNSVDDVEMVNHVLNSADVSLWQLLIPRSSGYYYRPLLYYTYVLDYHVWGLHESFMHLENVFLHAGNTILVFYLAATVSRVYGVNKVLVPFCAAVLFAIHPVNTEAVIWVSGRTDLMAGFFLLMAMILLIKGLREQKLGYLLMSSLAFFLGCLCKDSAIFFLPGALFCVYCYKGRKPEETIQPREMSVTRLFGYLFLLVASLGYFFLRSFAFSRGDGGIHSVIKHTVTKDADLLYNIKVLFKVSGFYLKKFFVPWPLNFAIVKISDLYIALGILLMILCVYLVYRREVISSVFLTGVGIMSAALLVVTGRMAWTPIAERYLYIPCALFTICTILLAYLLFSKTRWRCILVYGFPVLFAVFTWTTVARGFTWQENLRLYEDTLRKSPDFPPAKNEYAIALIKSGKVGEGYELLKKNRLAANLKNREYAVENAAIAMVSEGDLDGAVTVLKSVLDKKSQNYQKMLIRLVAIDGVRAVKSTDVTERKSIQKEIGGYLQELYHLTGDPFYCYRLGQNALAMHEEGEARSYFHQAYEKAPDGAYYREPARRLAQRLSQ